MPVEFISATHTTPTTEATAGGRRSGFDVDYARYVLPLVRQELARRPAARVPVPAGG